MKTICVYCGSREGHESLYAEAAVALANEMLNRKQVLVYGGASGGLMGTLADTMLEGNGQVKGIIPKAFVQRVAHRELTDLQIVESMPERKVKMFQAADGFVALPGGFGTLEEVLEILMWAQLGMHSKPCGLLNVDGYFDLLLQFVDQAVAKGFVLQGHREMLLVEKDPAALLDACASYEGKFLDKWSA